MMGSDRDKTMCLDYANQPRGQGESEDEVLVTDGLLGVFDSVGGRDQGRLVSRLAARTVYAGWQERSETECQGSLEQREALLAELLRTADAAIAALAIPPEQRRPATVAALCAYGKHQGQAVMSIAHVGDSRIYLLRMGHPLRRLTSDHGSFSLAVRRGILTENEARRIEQAGRADELSADDLAHFARRNQITCAIGWSDFPQIPTASHELLPGDGIILCTDGIHDNLADEEIEALLRSSQEASARRLVAAAHQRSQQEHLRAKPDDISAIVAWYLPAAQEERSR